MSKTTHTDELPSLSPDARHGEFGSLRVADLPADRPARLARRRMTLQFSDPYTSARLRTSNPSRVNTNATSLVVTFASGRS